MSNTFDRQALVEAYIDRLLDNMSTKDLMRIVGDQMEENITSYTDEELGHRIVPVSWGNVRRRTHHRWHQCPPSVVHEQSTFPV